MTIYEPVPARVPLHLGVSRADSSRWKAREPESQELLDPAVEQAKEDARLEADTGDGPSNMDIFGNDVRDSQEQMQKHLDDLLWRANDPVNPQALQHANAANMVLKTMSETFRIGATKYFDRGDKPRPELRKPDEFDTPGFQKALKEGDMSTVNAIMKGAKIPCRSQD
jgi:hypothetical protein